MECRDAREPPARRSARCYLAAVGATLTALLSVTGCLTQTADRGGDAVADRVFDSPTRTDLTLAEVADLARLEFPGGTVLTSTTYIRFLDWRLTAIATFPAELLDAFQTTNALRAKPASDDDLGTPSHRIITSSERTNDPMWDPDAARTVLEFGSNAAGETIDGVYRRILLDLDDPNTVTMYLVAFTT